MKLFILILIAIALLVTFVFLATIIFGAPFVPTNKKDLKTVFKKLCPLSEKDFVIDMGAGNGVVLAEASKHGASGLGVEINPFLVLYLKLKFRKNKKLKFKCRDFYRIDFPKETTVVYVYGLTPYMDHIYRKTKEEATKLKRPLRLVSNAFDIKDLKPSKKISQYYLYIVEPED